MDEALKASLDAIFRPRSVAVVGASNNPKRWGFGTLQTILEGGYRHPVYPVNPSQRQVGGIPCYKSVKDIPAEVDLAVIAVNVGAVEGVVRDCIAKGVKGGIVITAGFAEVGPDGAELQGRIAQIAKEGGFPFIGPNCWGIFSAEGQVNTIMGKPPPKGPIAFVSQSGSLGEYLMNMARKEGFGLSKLISCGNQACVGFTDLLGYLEGDPTTKVVVGYVEEVRDGRSFLKAARSLVGKKPLLIYKAGSTDEAARAARSHTGAMVGNDELFDAACRQAGVLRWDDVLELFHMAEALSFLPLPKGNSVAVISTGGGFCVTATEACSRMGLRLPALSQGAQRRILSLMRGFAPPPLNPVDCIARKDNDSYLDIIEVVASEPNIDSLIVTPRMGRFDRTTLPSSMVRRIQQAEAISTIPERYGKPLVCATEHHLQGPVYEVFKRRHIPFFEGPADCAKVLYALNFYARQRARLAAAQGQQHKDGPERGAA